jgi:hypothetical protein
MSAVMTNSAFPFGTVRTVTGYKRKANLRLWPLAWHSYEARNVFGNTGIYHIIYIPGYRVYLPG